MAQSRPREAGQRIPQATIEAALARRPLSDVLRPFANMKRAGREWSALCPFHKEKSASFFVNDDKGFAHCFGCGWHGNAISVLMELKHLEFPAAVEELLNADPYAEGDSARFERQFRNASEEYAAAGRWEPHPVDRAESAKARAMFENARPIKATPAEIYLRRHRRLAATIPDCCRFTSLPYWHAWRGAERSTQLGVFPCLLIAASDDSGICAVQIIYLGADGNKVKIPDRDNPGELLPAKKTRGPLGVGAVRLSRFSGSTLGLAEGGETGMAARQIYSLPVWASLGHQRFAARLLAGNPIPGARAVKLPRDVENLIIFADRKRTGEIDPVAFQAAESLEWQGYSVDVMPPPERFKDFNSILQGERL